MRPSSLFLSFLLPLMLLDACGKTSIPTTTPVPDTAAPSSVSLPTLTNGVPLTTARSLIFPTITPAGPQQAVLQTGVNLRAGPGMMFDILNSYAEGQSVMVLGQAPAGDWFQVEIKDGKIGWMRSAVLTLEGNAFDLPPIMPEGVLIIRGKVYTPNKNPASMVGVSLLENDSNTSPQMDVGNTNAFGEWYIYLPTSMAGEWTVRVDSYSCKSNTVNSVCDLIGQFPPAQTVTLPLPKDTWIDFEMLP